MGACKRGTSPRFARDPYPFNPMKTTPDPSRISARTLASFAFPDSVAVTDHGHGLRVIEWTETEGVRIQVYAEDDQPFRNDHIERGRKYFDDLIRAAERFVQTATGTEDGSFALIRFHLRLGRASIYVDLRDRGTYEHPSIAHRAEDMLATSIYEAGRDLERAETLVRFARIDRAAEGCA